MPSNREELKVEDIESGPMSLFNDPWWNFMTERMNNITSSMNLMAESMEKRMRQSMEDMQRKMKELETQVATSNIDEKPESPEQFHSCETHSFYDTNGQRVSHIKSVEKSSDGGETIKEEKRIGNQRKLVQKTRDKPTEEWKIEEKTENIDRNNEQAMLDFDVCFDKAFGLQSLPTTKEELKPN